MLVVNEALSRRVFPDEETVGQRLRRMGEIVGVVGDVRQRGLDAEPEPEIYLDYRQLPDRMSEALAGLGIVLQLRPGSEGLLESVKTTVSNLDPELPLADVAMMRSRLDASLARPRLYTILLSVFAAIALGLAASGVAGVISYQAAERTRENGLRMALGATASDILALTMGEGLRILGAGLIVGAAGAIALARSLRSVLFQVAPFDPIALAVAAATLSAAVVVSTALPARRAAHLDPMKALRHD